MTNKPYFLLVFQKNDPMPSIISADVIADICPCISDKTVYITYTNGDNCSYENVESFKMVPVVEIDFKM